MLLFRQWPRPPKMDALAYRHYRLRLFGLLLIWLVAAMGLFVFWQQLPVWVKVLSVFVSTVITPDVGMIEQLFASYERYCQRGLE